jgi:CRP/FNR family cyclic AMP-dependent transcriptional regulator
VCNPSILKNLPLFASLNDAQFGEVLSVIQHRSYPARVRILHAGESADALYVIIAGRVRVLFQDGEGHELIAASIGPNEFFGELGLVEGRPHASNFETESPCEVLVIPRKTVVECVEQNCGAAMAMLRIVMRRLDDANRKMASLALTDVYERVASVLLESRRETDGEWLVHVGSEQIAAMVGASREMVSRVVKDMIRRGAVRRHKRKLIVIDPTALGRKAVSDQQSAPAALKGSPPPSAA